MGNLAPAPVYCIHDAQIGPHKAAAQEMSALVDSAMAVVQDAVRHFTRLRLNEMDMRVSALLRHDMSYRDYVYFLTHHGDLYKCIAVINAWLAKHAAAWGEIGVYADERALALDTAACDCLQTEMLYTEMTAHAVDKAADVAWDGITGLIMPDRFLGRAIKRFNLCAHAAGFIATGSKMHRRQCAAAHHRTLVGITEAFQVRLTRHLTQQVVAALYDALDRRQQRDDTVVSCTKVS